uniref:Lon proteolytic domain-containing protein n=3 Tax=Meloidogyne TaxID=189290 RepID=A0A914NPJ2_MELIC
IEKKIRGVSYPLSAVSSTNKSLENTDMMKDTDDITEESKILAKIFTEKLAKERSLAYPPGNLFFICKADTKLGGDSAGVAMVLAIMSLVLNKAIPIDLCATGAIDEHGEMKALFAGKNNAAFNINPEPLTGPSCGVSFTIALLSIILGQAPPEDLCATGMITFNGDLKKIGGIKWKLEAAHAIGKKRIILPEENRDDFYNLSEEEKFGITPFFYNNFLMLTILYIHKLSNIVLYNFL